MKKANWICGGLFAALGAAASPAVAQGTPGLLEADRDAPQWYVGLNGTWADYDVGNFDEEWGGKLFGGYQHNRWLGFQLGYAYLGEYEANGGDVEVDGFELAALGHYPITPTTSVFGKVGAFAWDTSVDGTGVPVSDDSGTDATLGLGAEYSVTEQVGVRLEIERFMDVGDEDIDAISLGVVTRF
ncbi:outer membrane beta-barrel protein [Thiohalomonas denitrificans]|uniref:Opacity protein n=1 Tax=Thiohalomonas denitrificans TaxID=415747 RepID=A0A1G5QZT4_9GAMM|nr:outer membrane beta-barrel protein [Thiohalomonas denitrificans]SCZ67080.1 Opacity protein [Thiohalomonas denitrificans]